MNSRVAAAEAYVQSLKTGEPSAAERAAKHLAPDAVLSTGREEVKGRDEVLKRVTGQWPFTPVLIHGGWSDPIPEGDQLKVHADFPALGAAPAAMNLTFSFNGSDQISRVDQQTVMNPPGQPTEALPDFVRGIVNAALANGTPLCVAYVDENGQPVLSLRGSTVVFNNHQLAIWVRNAAGGIVKAMDSNPRLSLLYRDSKTRTTLIFQGRGHVATDEETRNRLYEMTPEVEQNHDPSRKGAALVIDVVKAQGGGPRGGVRVERTA
ncbi:MAG: pyridoxamine 5'-phosphate oxidase family protein [Chloroflexota bacterium]